MTPTSRTTAFLVTATLISGLAAPPAARADSSGYRVPGIVRAVSTGQLAGLVSEDQETKALISAYVVGFTENLDRSCGFLDARRFADLKYWRDNIVDQSQRNVADAGFLDSTLFVA